MKKIIAVYKQTVYDDGSIELKKLESADDDSIQDISKFSGCSARIAHTLELIQGFLSEYNDDLGVNYCWSLAVKNISSKYNINESSVIDKATRQIGYNTSEIKSILVKIYNKDNETIKELSDIMKQHSPNTSTKPADIKAIDDFFKSISSNRSVR